MTATRCANCGRRIAEGEPRWEFEGDDLEYWCANCGNEEEKRRAEAEVERLLAEIEADHRERIWEGPDLQWHYELTPHALVEIMEERRDRQQAAVPVGEPPKALQPVDLPPGAEHLRFYLDTEGYESEEAAREGLRAVKMSIVEERGRTGRNLTKDRGSEGA